jgi:Flp pilus assembly protein TadB
MEIFMAITLGILVFSLLLVRFAPGALQNDEIKQRVIVITNSAKRGNVLDEEMNKPLSERVIKPLVNSLILLIKNFLPEKSSQKGVGYQKTDKLKKQLRQAGIHLDRSEYQAVQILVAATGAILLGIFALVLSSRIHISLIAALVGAYAGYVGLRFNLTKRISNRHESMQRQLPEVLDMLSVSVEAGLGLEQAMLQVIDHFQGPLVDELSIAYREMTMGRTRREALLDLGERSGVEEVQSFARAVVQAGQMGISIKNVLQSQAEVIRQARRNKIEEKAMKISVKILIPMTLFIFPVIFIALLGPAAVNIYNQFK